MALVKGTNCGFVTVAPTADPEATGLHAKENWAHAFKDTAPVGAVKVTEIGWYTPFATEAADFDVGIYDHNTGDNNPEAKVGDFNINNPKGTNAGWKRATGLDIAITGNTIYWLAVQLDDTASFTYIDTTLDGGEKMDVILGSLTELPSPWGVTGYTDERLVAIYALYEVAGVTRKIKIAGTFQDKPIKEKKAGTFQDKPISIKVGGTFQDA